MTRMRKFPAGDGGMTPHADADAAEQSMSARAQADLDAAIRDAASGDALPLEGIDAAAARTGASNRPGAPDVANPSHASRIATPTNVMNPSNVANPSHGAADANRSRVDPALDAGNRKAAASYVATHFDWQVDGAVATVTLNRPKRKNPLTFESYAELRDLFGALKYADDVHAVVITGSGGNFCSGGDVHEIIGPLVRLKAPELLMFTRMTGDLVKAMRACPQPIVAAVDGVCAGAGAIVAMASDLRFGTARSKTAFLFNRVGLAGCDMGACALLPRIVGQGRASEWLFTGRSLSGDEAERWGFFNRLCEPDVLLREAQALATSFADGPTFANGITKTMLQHEWAMTIEQAIEAEAQAQALCMLTEDFRRAYDAFVAKQKPKFEGN